LSNRPCKLQNVRLTTHFRHVLRLRTHGAIQVLRVRTHGAIQVLRLRMHGTVSPSPYIPSWCAEG